MRKPLTSAPAFATLCSMITSFGVSQRVALNPHPLTAAAPSPAQVYYIYVLIDPRTYQVKYVGQTHDPKYRYSKHICFQAGKSYRASWLNKLRKLKIKPIMIIIEECDESDWAERETYWIRWYRKDGCSLVNATDGGEGTLGYKHSNEARKVISDRAKVLYAGTGNPMYGKNHTKETILKISAAKRNPSEELRKRLSESHKGLNLGENHPNAKLTEHKVRDIRYFLSFNIPAREIADMYEVERITISKIKTGSNWGWLE